MSASVKYVCEKIKIELKNKETNGIDRVNKNLSV